MIMATVLIPLFVAELEPVDYKLLTVSKIRLPY
jgi:hypothetical protein